MGKFNKEIKKKNKIGRSNKRKSVNLSNYEINQEVEGSDFFGTGNDFFSGSNLEKLRDEELVSLYKKGVNEALDILIKRYKNVILSKILLFYLPAGEERDDLIQEAYMGFLSAIRDFDENKGNFYSFAGLCIQRHIYTFIKSLNRNKNKILKGAVSLESTFGKDHDLSERKLEEYLTHTKISSDIPSAISYLPSDEVVAINLDYKEKREKIMRKLTLTEKEILKYRALGYSYKEIAKLTGKSVKSVDNALQRIKKKVKLILEED